MSSLSRKLYQFSFQFIRILTLIFTGILLLGGFFGTCYALDMTTQQVLTKWDNPLSGLCGLAVFFLFFSLAGYFVCHNFSRRLPLLLGLVLVWCTILGILLILFSKTVPAADALSVYTIAESLSVGDTSVIHPTESYLSYYPQQVGLTAFFELLIRIWNLLPVDLPAYHMIKCIYVLLAWVIILYQYNTVDLLWHNERINCIYLLLTGANLPFFMYTSFVYGEIPSFAAISAGIYYLLRLLAEGPLKPSVGSQPAIRTHTGIFFSASLLLITLSVFLRKNSLIFVIAVILVVLFQWLKEKRHILLLFALLCATFSLTILPLTQKYYEHRAGSTLSAGVPAISYLAMGMQESSRGNGWYNGFNFNTYQETGMDSAATAAISRKTIEERLAYFKENPGYAADFYLHKYLSQWSDGTYACRQATLATFGGRRDFFNSLYAGNSSKYFIAYCNHYQNVLYLGVFLFCLGSFLLCGRRLRASGADSLMKSPADSGAESPLTPGTDSLAGLPLYLGLIAVFGGFLFHMFWEANSRYIFLYGLLLLPYAACGLEWGSELMKTFAKNRKKNQ